MERSSIVREGAILLGIYLLLTFITLLIPVVGIISMFLLPVPFVFFTKKYGLKPAILFGILSFFFIFIFVGPVALPITISFAIGGIVIGELYHREKDAFAVLLGGSLSFISSLLVLYIGSILLLGVNPMEEMQNIFTESLETTEEMLILLSMEDDSVLEVAEEMIQQFVYVAPTIIIMLGVFFAFVVQWISSRFLIRRKYTISQFPPFREWTFPRAFIWYYLITYLFLLIGTEVGSPMYIVIVNLRPILETVMVIQGFCFMYFYFHHKKKSIVWPILLTITAFLLPILLYIIRILGIIDLGFELRKRMNSKK
ncbi:YybS family protein [Evansella tamaricis]|uniref:YybS family protein n=1 Tax=Evansella tamaricis TaxID=2069301 RepID=A0ABS6JB56_9BACI|nr:YybS family protein [Evansella tamaricis]MBU9710911.1 YybS family protein [Evansella tamaricis]